MELFIGGGIILIYLGIVIACVFWALARAARKQLSVWGKTGTVLGVLFVAYAIPFGDHTVGYIYFTGLCERDAGTRMYRTASKVEGLLSPTGDGQMARILGYKYVEQGVNPNKVTRYEIVANEIVEFKNVQAISRYALGYRTAERILWARTGQYVITDLSTKEVLAVHTDISYDGGWLIRAILSGYGSTAGQCPKEAFDVVKFIATILKPTTEGN